MPILVTLDNDTSPTSATFLPAANEVDDKNCQIVTWIRNPGQTFKFVAVKWINDEDEAVQPLPNPPFSKPFVVADGAAMVMADFNAPDKSETPYYYQIEVSCGDNHFFFPATARSAQPGHKATPHTGPTIKNK